MMTREEILSIEEFCAEHKVSHRKRLEELDIPFWHFCKSKKKYRKEDEEDSHPGEFIQLSSGRFVSQVMPLSPSVLEPTLFDMSLPDASSLRSFGTTRSTFVGFH